MERKTKPDTNKPKWRKIGGGTLRLGDRIIKPNQVFSAHESEIPKAFRDTLLLVEGDITSTAPASEIPDTKTLFAVKGSKVDGWNVVNTTTGKPINETPLTTKKEAEELLKTLS